jgi:hypothetical protein
MQEVLLGLVRGRDGSALFRKRPVTSQFHAKESFERVNACAGILPVFVAIPLERGLHGLGRAPTMGKPELSEHGAGGGEAEVFHQILAQEPHRHCIEKQRTLSSEADYTAFRIDL